MKKIRTLVIDDEPLARARIIKLLGSYDFISILGECKNGKEAQKSISNYKPDLIFLDIQMPDLNGFEVLNNIDPKPFIIFVTAFDQYALQAFDVRAVDYLLKPYDNDRFEQALLHAKAQIQLKENAVLHTKMVQLLQSHQQQQSDELMYITLKEKGRTIQLPTNDICYIEAEGNYLNLYTEHKTHLLRQTMQELENLLNKAHFLKIHRSILINTNYLKSIKYKGNNQYSFTLNNDVKLLSSRSHKADIITFLEDREIRNSQA